MTITSRSMSHCVECIANIVPTNIVRLFKYALNIHLYGREMSLTGIEVSKECSSRAMLDSVTVRWGLFGGAAMRVSRVYGPACDVGASSLSCVHCLSPIDFLATGDFVAKKCMGIETSQACAHAADRLAKARDRWFAEW